MKQVIILNDHKVFKLTNGKGHLGLPIPGSSVKRTFGVKWNLLKDKHEPDDTSVVIARYMINRLKKDTYEIECLDEFMPSLMIFLLYKCGTVDVTDSMRPTDRRRYKRRYNVKVHQASYLKYGLR